MRKFYNTVVIANFPALTHDNFRIYWIGQCVSLIGTWAQSIGQTWLVLSLTGSPLLLGILGAIQFLPITIFSLFAGVIIDRYPKNKIILITQFTSMILAFSLSALVFTHTVRYEYILILALILGFSNTIDIPTRQAFMIELASKKDLMNAIALNSATFNLARILGPAIGALIMASFGAGWCFLLNGFSFMAVIASLLRIEVTPYVRRKVSDNNMLKEIVDGLKYIAREPILLQTIIMVLIVGIFVFNFNILIPVFTKNVLLQGEKVYGLLMSALGAGSLVGALIVSVRSKSGPKIKILLRSSIMVSLTLILISFTRTYYFTAILLVITGIFNIWFSTTANSTLQITSEDEYRGRVMSVYSLVFAGASPIGNMFAGLTTNMFGANTSFLLCGVLTVIMIALLKLLIKIKLNNKKLHPSQI
ncbi:MAG: MFS transporter [Desulfosporosinus sp. BRH_c37]|nr:MAG: MFS transporter [Desulfosporosinus sp. BRH_c37]